MPLIYIVEDDEVLADELAHLLVLQDFEVTICDHFDDVAAEVASLRPDCVILDLMLPGADGHAICQTIRRSSSVPILVLTSCADDFSEVMALGLGADDFLTKPYKPHVLLARLSSVLRRANASSLPAQREYLGLCLDMNAMTVRFAQKSAELTRNEFKILSILMRTPGKVVSRQDMMLELWESDEFIDDNTLTVNINRLRKTLSSLGVDDDFLKTKRGQGYYL